MARIEDVVMDLKPKLIFFSCLSILYDLPRLYLNVNLFGSLCSFYYNVIEQVTVVTTLRHDDGKKINAKRFDFSDFEKKSSHLYMKNRFSIHVQFKSIQFMRSL